MSVLKTYLGLLIKTVVMMDMMISYDNDEENDDNSDGFILHFQDISHGGIWGSEKRDENHRSLGCLSRESQHYRRPRSIIDARPNIFNYYFIKTFAHPYEGNWLCYLFYISLPYFVTLKVPWSSRLSRTHAFLTYL